MAFSLKSLAVTLAGTAGGAVVAGPLGLAVGAASGGIIDFIRAKAAPPPIAPHFMPPPGVGAPPPATAPMPIIAQVPPPAAVKAIAPTLAYGFTHLIHTRPPVTAPAHGEPMVVAGDIGIPIKASCLKG